MVIVPSPTWLLEGGFGVFLQLAFNVALVLACNFRRFWWVLLREMETHGNFRQGPPAQRGPAGVVYHLLSGHALRLSIPLPRRARLSSLIVLPPPAGIRGNMGRILRRRCFASPRCLARHYPEVLTTWRWAAGFSRRLLTGSSRWNQWWPGGSRVNHL